MSHWYIWFGAEAAKIEIQEFLVCPYMDILLRYGGSASRKC